MARNKKKHPGGRPTVMTQSVIDKLEAAFSKAATDEQACFYAGISPDALYKYIRKNPKFGDRKECLKETLILKAKEELFQGLKGNPDLALRVLERKAKDEGWSPRQELTGPNGKPIQTNFTYEERLKKARENINARKKQKK